MADMLLAIASISLAEGYFLQRSVLNEHSFRSVCLGAVGVNLALKVFWDLIIYPFFVTPNRHLPTVKVSSRPCVSQSLITSSRAHL
jgi:hypothetical protein